MLATAGAGWGDTSPCRTELFGSSTLIPVYEPRGTTSTRPTRPSAGSLTSTPPDRHREYHQVVDTIIAWGAQILAYHTSRQVSNGPLEGINNLLQVLRRVAHGFTNYDNYAARGILAS